MGSSDTPNDRQPPNATDRPRVDADREAIARILATPLDEGVALELDEAEAPLDDPWSPGAS